MAAGVWPCKGSEEEACGLAGAAAGRAGRCCVLLAPTAATPDARRWLEGAVATAESRCGVHLLQQVVGAGRLPTHLAALHNFLLLRQVGTPWAVARPGPLAPHPISKRARTRPAGRQNVA